MKIDQSRIVVCDAGPLIHLDQLQSLDLLPDLGRLVMPHAVWEEVKHHRPQFVPQPPLVIERLDVKTRENLKDSTLFQILSLDKGEREALFLMADLCASMFLTDDAAARLVATGLGYEVHGTIGVLLRAIRQGYRTKEEVKTLLTEIPKRSTLYIQKGLLNEIIDRLG